MVRGPGSETYFFISLVPETKLRSVGSHRLSGSEVLSQKQICLPRVTPTAGTAHIHGPKVYWIGRCFLETPDTIPAFWASLSTLSVLQEVAWHSVEGPSQGFCPLIWEIRGWVGYHSCSLVYLLFSVGEKFFWGMGLVHLGRQFGRIFTKL